MELWIRSQDKMDLVKVRDLHIEEIPSSTEVDIIGYYYDKSYTRLGFYETKERALEVLDEIQNILSLKDMYKSERELVLKSWENVDAEQVQIVRQQMSVYEMPKE